MLAEFRRVGVLTAGEFAAAKPRLRPIGPLRQKMSRDLTAVLRRLPDGAGPIALRDLMEVALAEYHQLSLLQPDA
jgi:hypothetical protein